MIHRDHNSSYEQNTCHTSLDFVLKTCTSRRQTLDIPCVSMHRLQKLCTGTVSIHTCLQPQLCVALMCWLRYIDMAFFPCFAGS